MPPDRLCDRCGVQPARLHTISVLGPIDLRADSSCEGCQARADVEAEQGEPVPADSYQHLGPIEFEVLRESIRNAEQRGEEPALLRFVARELPGIAAAHGQQLPDDIQRFVERYGK